MPSKTQVKLLRVLQEREVTPVGGTSAEKIDVRILAATNVDLEEAVSHSRFREDLYYRLNVLRLHTPKLSEREDDVVLLANHFLERKARGRKRFSSAALAEIARHAWPGNVRQLENAVERAIAFTSEETIDRLDLDARRETPEKTAPGSDSPGSTALFPPSLNEVEKAYIYWVLSQNQWQKAKVAKILGLDISTLYRKIEKYGLKPNP
jgi:DNA-binding NtrC family response regulator